MLFARGRHFVAAPKKNQQDQNSSAGGGLDVPLLVGEAAKELLEQTYALFASKRQERGGDRRRMTVASFGAFVDSAQLARSHCPTDDRGQPPKNNASDWSPGRCSRALCFRPRRRRKRLAGTSTQIEMWLFPSRTSVCLCSRRHTWCTRTCRLRAL